MSCNCLVIFSIDKLPLTQRWNWCSRIANEQHRTLSPNCRRCSRQEFRQTVLQTETRSLIGNAFHRRGDRETRSREFKLTMNRKHNVVAIMSWRFSLAFCNSLRADVFVLLAFDAANRQTVSSFWNRLKRHFSQCVYITPSILCSFIIEIVCRRNGLNARSHAYPIFVWMFICLKHNARNGVYCLHFIAAFCSVAMSRVNCATAI